jgi:hypothetical protein
MLPSNLGCTPRHLRDLKRYSLTKTEPLIKWNDVRLKKRNENEIIPALFRTII